MKKFPFVSIVICTRNRAEALKKFALKSILKIDYPNYEVVVVDDASEDKTQEILKEFKNKIKNLIVIKNKKSRGLCYVRNLGIKHSKGEMIAFTDDDCVMDRNWLKELVKPYLRDKEVMVAGGHSYIGNSNKLFNYNRRILGCNMSFRKEIFKRFLFDVNLYYNKSSFHDETELIYRLKNKNFKVVYADKAIVKHFCLPAKYKSNIKFGDPLNRIYMYTKKISLTQYYFFLFVTLLLGKRKRDYSPTNVNEIIEGFDAVRGLLLPKHKAFFKLPWIFYVLLLEIPIKAKIKNWLEERKINN